MILARVFEIGQPALAAYPGWVLLVSLLGVLAVLLFLNVIYGPATIITEMFFGGGTTYKWYRPYGRYQRMLNIWCSIGAAIFPLIVALFVEQLVEVIAGTATLLLVQFTIFLIWIEFAKPPEVPENKKEVVH